MAINFPNNPQTGEVYNIGTKKWKWTGVSWTTVDVGDGTVITQQDTPPTAPSLGDLWFNTGEGILLIYYNDGSGPSQWVDLTGGTTITQASNAIYTPAGVNAVDTTVEAKLREIDSSSSTWDSTYTTVSANSATWGSGSGYDDTTLQAASGNWESTYTTVDSSSGNWESTYTTVDSSSGNWESTYTTVSANSATWGSGGTLPSITETATFSASNNNINATGIGTLTDLAIGDVIEVSGSVSNDNTYTVEDITNNDNIIVNAAHAGGLGSKSLTDESAAGTVTVQVIARAKDAPLGLGQGWVSYSSGSGDRSHSVTYTNSTGRPISILINKSTQGISTVQIDGASVTSWRADGATNLRIPVTFIVSPGSTYLITNTGYDIWSELR